MFHAQGSLRRGEEMKSCSAQKMDYESRHHHQREREFYTVLLQGRKFRCCYRDLLRYRPYANTPRRIPGAFLFGFREGL